VRTLIIDLEPNDAAKELLGFEEGDTVRIDVAEGIVRIL
jgi:hypothetical protein